MNKIYQVGTGGNLVFKYNYRDNTKFVMFQSVWVNKRVLILTGLSSERNFSKDILKNVMLRIKHQQTNETRMGTL